MSALRELALAPVVDRDVTLALTRLALSDAPKAADFLSEAKRAKAPAVVALPVPLSAGVWMVATLDEKGATRVTFLPSRDEVVVAMAGRGVA